MPTFSLLLLLLLLLLLPPVQSQSDAEALLSLKSTVDIHSTIPWNLSTADDMCKTWLGVKQCSADGRVTKLVLESLNLTGILPSGSLSPLDQLRVLSLKSNSLSGAIPDLSALASLKSLFLGGNHFSGGVPTSLTGLHRLKVIVLDNNRLSGSIPHSFTGIGRLYTLLLQDNHLSGSIPAFNQPGLRVFNVSGNDLSGEVPNTQALAQFDAASFLGNPNLCGAMLQRPCSIVPSGSPSSSPSPSALDINDPQPDTGSQQHRRRKRVIGIITGSIAGSIVVLVCLLGLIILMCRRRKPRVEGGRARSVADKSVGEGVSWSAGTGGEEGKDNYKWEAEQGRLEFCGGAGEVFGLEELLRASAEMLGRGTVGSTYKAVMETGYIVTVKRLAEAAEASPRGVEFARRMEELGRLRHPNLVPLKAYFQAKEERLLVYEYFPNGSLFSLIHGSRACGSGKPLHWTSCLKIAEDVASGLLYLHTLGTVHGNLKSSNVLLGPDFESCLTDYALVPYLNSIAPGDSAAAALFYRAPESRHLRKPVFTPASDVYSFGVLLLKLLTGKTPFQDLVERHGADIPRWVRSVREEESAESGGDDPTAEEKLTTLLAIAMACVAVTPEKRLATKEVLRRVREARVEAMVSSNSSDHSPGRWSDTVQGLGLPRDQFGSESFAERD